jgi:O-antigen/teichoic acid export membrane protein
VTVTTTADVRVVDAPPSALRSAGVLAFAGLIANVASLLLTVLIARPLGERDYGIVVTLMGLFLVLAIPGSALLVAVVRRVTAWECAGQGELVEPWVHRVRRAGYLALAGFAVLAIASRWLVADLLNLPGPSGVAEILIAGAGWAMLAVDRGLLQARRQYSPLAGSVVMEAVARMVITAGLVAVGVGVEANSVGLLAALVGGDLIARRALARSRDAQTDADTPLDEEQLLVAAAPVAPVVSVVGRKQLAIDVVAAVAALALLAVLQNLDAVIVGREAPANRGPYGAISVSCKALIFGALVLSGYLVPEAATRSHRGEHALRPLFIASGLLAVPAAALCLIAFVAPETLLRVVFGSDLVAAAPAFFLLALGMSALGLAVLLTHYLLGCGRRKIVIVLAGAALANAVLVTGANGDPVATAWADLVCNTALVLAAAAMVWFAHRPTFGGRVSSDDTFPPNIVTNAAGSHSS